MHSSGPSPPSRASAPSLTRSPSSGRASQGCPGRRDESAFLYAATVSAQSAGGGKPGRVAASSGEGLASRTIAWYSAAPQRQPPSPFLRQVPVSGFPPTKTGRSRRSALGTSTTTTSTSPPLPSRASSRTRRSARVVAGDPEGIGSTGHEPGGSKVQLTLENNIVARTLRQQHALEGRVPARALSDLGEYELAAVRIAFARGRVTASELAARIGRTRRSASGVLKGLGPEGRGVLAWHGTATNDPKQYYTIA